MNNISPLLQSDSYKQSHWMLYPDGLEYLYSNTTPRSSRIEGVESVIHFGLQYFIKEYLINQWQENFFLRDVEEVLVEYHRVIDRHLGPDTISDDNIRYLHSLGHLPIKIKSLPEGELVPIKVPVFTIINTDPKCAWLTNFLETISQTIYWRGVTSATISFQYRKLVEKYGNLTCDNLDHADFQCHDFSLRGMPSLDSSCVSGAAHLLSFKGTDSIPSIPFLEEYYYADITQEDIGFSVKATEHSIQCSYEMLLTEDTDVDYIQEILRKVPTGIISIVCDGFDYYKFITEILPLFKEEILARDGKIVVRPDSGNPVDIICGHKYTKTHFTLSELKEYLHRKDSGELYVSRHMKTFEKSDVVKTVDNKYFNSNFQELSKNEVDGSIKILYDIFGGTVNDKSYSVLDPHIGLIYGDSITYKRAKIIFEKLKDKKFASSNVVLGIGSYTFQYVTRDTLGLACKSTWAQINGQPKDIFKDPKTDNGMKKSAKGLLRVDKIDGEYVLKDQCTPEEESGGELQTIFENGVLVKDQSFAEIKQIVSSHLS